MAHTLRSGSFVGVPVTQIDPVELRYFASQPDTCLMGSGWQPSDIQAVREENIRRLHVRTHYGRLVMLVALVAAVAYLFYLGGPVPTNSMGQALERYDEIRRAR